MTTSKGDSRALSRPWHALSRPYAIYADAITSKSESQRRVLTPAWRQRNGPSRRRLRDDAAPRPQLEPNGRSSRRRPSIHGRSNSSRSSLVGGAVCGGPALTIGELRRRLRERWIEPPACLAANRGVRTRSRRMHARAPAVSGCAHASRWSVPQRTKCDEDSGPTTSAGRP